MKRGALRFFIVTACILLISSVFIWGYQTSWGKISIERLTLMAKDGTKLSTLIYIPENATSETPAPGAIVYHGRSQQGHGNDTWCMELARRGMVVLSPDMSGGGESDVTDRNMHGDVILDYAMSIDIIEKGNINLIGYSAGSSNALMTARFRPQHLNSSLMVFGPFFLILTGSVDAIKDIQTDFGIIKSTADQYDYFFIGDPAANRGLVSKAVNVGEMVESNKDYILNDSGSLFRYTEVGGTLHQTGNISSETIAAIIDFEGTVVDFPIHLENNDQAWGPQQFWSAVAAIDVLFLLAALIGLLLESSLFSSIINKRPQLKARTGAKAWILDILFSFIIPTILFVPVSAYAMAFIPPSKILSAPALTGIMAWLLSIAVIAVVRMVIRSNKMKKAGTPLQLSDYAIAAEGDTSIKWVNVAKALLIGVIVVVFFGIYMTALEAYLGVNFQIWNLATYLKPSGERILKSIPYMLIIFTVMFVGNMNQRTLLSTGNERKDMIIAVAVNAFLTASALFFLLLLQYGGSLLVGTGETIIPQLDVYGTGKNTSVGALDFAFGYCYMMGGTTAVVTYIYRKYGNIWAGVIPCAIFAGLFTYGGFSIVI